MRSPRKGDAPGFEGPGPIQIVGYEYSSFAPGNASFGLLFQGQQGGCVGVAMQMLWQGGDWKYVIPPSGTPAMQTVGSCSASGYLQWGGVQ